MGVTPSPIRWAAGRDATVAPALESGPAPPTDGQVVAGHIAWLREQGCRRRLRVQIPTLTFGACLTIVGAVRTMAGGVVREPGALRRAVDDMLLAILVSSDDEDVVAALVARSSPCCSGGRRAVGVERCKGVSPRQQDVGAAVAPAAKVPTAPTAGTSDYTRRLR